MARRMLLLFVVAALILPAAAFGDWDPTQPSKWVQFPDLSTFGIDVNASGPFILADDFQCITTGPITDVHIWGSWLGDYVTDAVFTISIHADIPADPPGGIPYSMPGAVLWTRTFYPGDYVMRLWAEGIEEGWMDPPEAYLFPADHICFQYNFLIPETEAFIQHGTPELPIVYWLDVHADPIEPGALFGWKTTPDHWNDDAVWGQGVEPYLGPWFEMRYPPNHELYGQSIDLAFVITTLEQGFSDWGDAPDPSYPTLAASNGANHTIVAGGPWLGGATDAPDGEADGQPDPLAKGDDVTNNDDEDGIQIPPLVLGRTATILYEINGVPGCVDGWIDFNGDQIWQDPAERVLATPLLPPGTYAQAVTVPGSAIVGRTFARFRVSTVGSLLPTGWVVDGEVEDHLVTILEPRKWIQAPDLAPTGIDVNATEPYILADDFLCTEQGRVVEIQVWGSWLNDYLPYGNPTAVDFVLSFHSDVPVGPGGYSQPDAPLWWRYFPMGSYTAEVWHDQLFEGWMDPPSQYIYPADTICWLYTFYVPAEEAFFQAGTEMEPRVYWLDVQALPHDLNARFGWKTSLDHWNDDAVWGQGVEPYPGPWNELRYPMGHQWEGISIDLAFALRTDPASGAPIKGAGEMGLYQNQPNPFKSYTTITYQLPVAGHAKLEVFDVTGRSVATLVDEVRPGGLSSVEWNGTSGDGRGVSGGVYFYRLTVGGWEITNKMMFLK